MNTRETCGGGNTGSGSQADEVIVHIGRSYGCRHLVLAREDRWLTVYHRPTGRTMRVHITDCEPVR